MNDELSLSRQEYEILLASQADYLHKTQEDQDNPALAPVWHRHEALHERMHDFHFAQKPRAARYKLVKVTTEEGAGE